MTQASSRSFDPRHLARFGMSAEDAVRLAKFPELLFRKEFLIREDGVESEAAMPLAQNASIPFLPLRIFCIVAQNIIVEDSKNLNERECRAHMAASERLEHPNDGPSQIS